MSFLKNPVILSLDVDDKDEALSIIDQLHDIIGAVKIGPRLGYKYGSSFIKDMALKCPVFVDNKYLDITSTVLSAIKTSFEAGASLVTIHALCGPQTLKAAADLEKQLQQIRPFQILVVTILTSWDENDYPVVFKESSVKAHVLALAQQSYECGLKGLVCSGEELAALPYKDVFVVTPGIRFTDGQKHDQKRTMTPGQAIANGSKGLVIGRAILESQNKRATVLNILKDLNESLNYEKK